MVDDLVRRRATNLARGLRRLSAPGGVMPVLVCDAHANDRHVACLAATMHGSSPLVLPIDAPELEPHRGEVLIACAEGVAAWRATGVPMRVVGEGVDVVWWKALELREAR